ncbi:TetR/AcrR family transcriptional regulator [Pseudoruegeria sp. SK021]|uniref:TetR/AcrR family transcriptional regulator n=1 Tax=Pseudoruegeria sp. SK021 TaxID=1933035 RepID=UPI000A25AE93|nr:TetR/AcrR family transcriptional regulator [Pseudoruegeria sp. SK021]OSP54696.1 hypothetical protein BV911_11060 [Pseudoruegeria sp. SK021]
METETRPSPPQPGRPRGFDRDHALENALTTFWRNGFEATSVEDLTSAMGISRSSLYGCFGPKRDVLLAALRHYSAERLTAFTQMADQADASTMRRLLSSLAETSGGSQGCLLVNCITELAPHDPEIAALGRQHIDQLGTVLATALARLGTADAPALASTFVTLALGTVTLRKAGFPATQIETTLDHAYALLSRRR